jgi:O-antigen/teichoic acid export membrane protein
MGNQKQEGRHLLAKNSIFNLFGQILPMLVGIVTIPYIVKGLGPDGYGILSIAYLVLGYFGIFDLGLSRATVKFVAEHLSPDKVHKVPGLVWTSLSLLVALGCTVGAISAAFVPVAVTHFFKMPPSFEGQAKTALFILSLSMPIMLSNDALRGVLEAAQRFDFVNYVKVPASILFYLFAALLIPFGVHVSGIVFVLVLIRFTSSIAYLSFCFRVFPELRKGIRISKEAFRPLTVFGGWIMVSNLMGPIFGYLERFMIASILSVGMLTYYSVPFDLVGKILIFPASVVPSLFPYFSYHGARSRQEVSEVTSRVMKYLFLVMTPIIAVFVFFAKDILTLWIGAQFASQSATVLRIVAFLFFLNAFAMIPFTSVQALGRPDLKAILDMIVLPIYAVGAWWLMHRMGVNGAALAKLFITILDCTVLYVFAQRLRAFSLRDCFSGPLFRAIAASGGLFLAVFLVSRLHVSLIVSACLLVVCFACYAGIFWIVAVDDEDRITLRGLIERALFVVKLKTATPSIEITGNDAGI